jgi:hypothetical protein
VYLDGQLLGIARNVEGNLKFHVILQGQEE